MCCCLKDTVKDITWISVLHVWMSQSSSIYPSWIYPGAVAQPARTTIYKSVQSLLGLNIIHALHLTLAVSTSVPSGSRIFLWCTTRMWQVEQAGLHTQTFLIIVCFIFQTCVTLQKIKSRMHVAQHGSTAHSSIISCPSRAMLHWSYTYCIAVTETSLVDSRGWFISGPFFCLWSSVLMCCSHVNHH